MKNQGIGSTDDHIMLEEDINNSTINAFSTLQFSRKQWENT
jgi:hypothetical protein